MGTSNRFVVHLGGASIATAWSFHSANKKLISAVMQRASEGGDFPVDGQIFNGLGNCVKSSHFPCVFRSNEVAAL